MASNSHVSSTPWPAGGRTVGRVAALSRYPVKSMAAEALDEVDVSWHGLSGDRRWAFIRNGLVHNGFPWLTIRQRHDMGLYRPYFAEPDRPDASRTFVRTPSGSEFEVVDPALAAELGDGVRVMKQDRGIFDTMPLSLITTQSVAALGALVDAKLNYLRFRPNLLIEATAEVAAEVTFPEDTWIGRTLRIGDMQIRADGRDKRCVIVNIDPVTTQRDPAILRKLTLERELCLGIYGTTVQPGRIAVGDPVFIA